MQQTIKKRRSDNPSIVEAATSLPDSEGRISEMAAILAAGIVRLKLRLGSPELQAESLSSVTHSDGR